MFDSREDFNSPYTNDNEFNYNGPTAKFTKQPQIQPQVIEPEIINDPNPFLQSSQYYNRERTTSTNFGQKSSRLNVTNGIDAGRTNQGFSGNRSKIAGPVVHNMNYQNKLNKDGFNIIEHFGDEMLNTKRHSRPKRRQRGHFMEEEEEEKVVTQVREPLPAPPMKIQKKVIVKENKVVEEFKEPVPVKAYQINEPALFCGNDGVNCRLI